MPIPTPRADETEQEFVNRFMGNDTAISDFPDEKQRAAVAYRTYRDEEMEELELGGVSILTIGEAKGHDLYIDRKSLETALAEMKKAKNGVKVKMNHGSGLDAVVGFARNPRIEGDKLIADLRLLRNSPHYGLIKEMASEAPDQFGVSLAFANESETIEGKDYVRVANIQSADLVSSPAANASLLEEMLAFAAKKLGYMAGGNPIPVDLPEAVVEGKGLTKEEKTMQENKADYTKDIEDIKVRLSKLEESMTPKTEETKSEAPEISVEVEPSEKEDNSEEMAKKPKVEEMSELVKKVLTEFGIKPVPASPVTEEAPAKKEEPKNFEALVAAHPDYGTSKLKAMKAVMLSNPKEYSEALARGISKL